MLEVEPSGEVLGARIHGLSLSQPLSAQDLALVIRSLGTHGVLCFPGQALEPADLKAFAAQFGTLEVNVAASHYRSALPEVMVLSNMLEEGRPIGLPDAGQDWHTDMSYSKRIGFATVLYAVKIPRREGHVLGNTEFLNMHRAFEELPSEVKRRLQDATATHDFNKFWEMMRKSRGSDRPPLSEEQRRQKPPVSHPIFLRHPLTGHLVLYANPGYTVRIDGWPPSESDDMLRFLFEHQLQAKYRYAHRWTEGDVLMWDNLGTVHRAIADYRSDEHRLMRRCQVIADRVFDPDFPAVTATVN
jgi:alpha-ketoglutarate-dependent taurine dioxygenase